MENLQELAEKYLQNKNTQNFNLLYKRLYHGLHNYILGFLLTSHGSQRDETKFNIYGDILEHSNDICQEVFVKAFLNLDKYDNKYNFSTWIYRIARNEILQFKEKMKKSYEIKQKINDFYNLKIRENDLTFGFKHAIEEKEKEDLTKSYICDKILDEIINLSSKYQQIIIDREIDGLSYKEIAKKNEVDMQTVKNRIRLGKKKIKKKLIEEYDKIWE